MRTVGNWVIVFVWILVCFYLFFVDLTKMILVCHHVDLAYIWGTHDACPHVVERCDGYKLKGLFGPF